MLCQALDESPEFSPVPVFLRSANVRPGELMLCPEGHSSDMCLASQGGETLHNAYVRGKEQANVPP